MSSSEADFHLHKCLLFTDRINFVACFAEFYIDYVCGKITFSNIPGNLHYISDVIQSNDTVKI